MTGRELSQINDKLKNEIYVVDERIKELEEKLKILKSQRASLSDAIESIADIEVCLFSYTQIENNKDKKKASK